MRRGSLGRYQPIDSALTTVDPPCIQLGAGLLSVEYRAPVVPAVDGGICGFNNRQENFEVSEAM